MIKIDEYLSKPSTLIKKNLFLPLFCRPWSVFLCGTAIFLCASPNLNAQESLHNSPGIELLDTHYGRENLDIFNGTRFYDLYGSTPENYRYFDRYQSGKGTVTYNGQVYTDIPMRYDLVAGDLIVFSDEKSSFFQIKLAKAKISGFTLFDNTNFEKEDLSKSYGYAKDAFFEVAFSGTSLELLISHSKAPEPKRRNERVFYIFKNKQEYFIKNGGGYLRMDNSRDLKTYFPDHKKQISQFYRNYRKLRKSDYKKFMQNLTTLLDRLVSP